MVYCRVICKSHTWNLTLMSGRVKRGQLSLTDPSISVSLPTNLSVMLHLRICLIGRFAFNTPFTPSGKAHGDVTEQYMRKTILTSMECFPYVKKRSKVVKLDTVCESQTVPTVSVMSDSNFRSRLTCLLLR